MHTYTVICTANNQPTGHAPLDIETAIELQNDMMRGTNVYHYLRRDDGRIVARRCDIENERMAYRMELGYPG